VQYKPYNMAVIFIAAYVNPVETKSWEFSREKGLHTLIHT